MSSPGQQIDAYLEQARMQHRSGNLPEAARLYRLALQLEPRHRAGLLELGNALLEMGLLEPARIGLEQATSIHPEDAALHNILGTVLQEQGDGTAAIAAFRKATELAPDMPNAHVRLGYALWMAGHLPEAVEAFRREIAIQPSLPNAHGLLGEVLIELGELKEGRLALLEALRLSPRHIPTLRKLSEIARFAGGGPSAAELRSLIAKPLSLSDQTELAFAVAQACEDERNFDEAFKFWSAGNTLKRKSIAYDETATLRFMKESARVFGKPLPSLGGGTSDGPIFIVGMPRSGTTLVEQVLASHPGITGGGELPYFPQLVEKALQSHGGPSGLPALTKPDIHVEMGLRYMARIREISPGRVADKLPNNFQILGLICLALPNARIIHVSRDPLDTCLSCFKTLFSEGNFFSYDLVELGRFYRAYEALMSHWRSVIPADRFLDVGYEDMVHNLEREAKRMIAYCDLEWDERCLSFHVASRPVRTASAAQVRQPLYASSIGRWRRYDRHLGPLKTALAG